MGKSKMLVIIVALIFAVAGGLYFWQIQGGKLVMLPGGRSSDRRVAVETDTGIYVINKDKGVYRMEKIELPAVNPILGWWISDQRLLVLDGETRFVDMGDGGCEVKVVNGLCIIKRDRNKWSVEKNITLPNTALCKRVSGTKSDQCVLLFPSGEKSFSDDAFTYTEEEVKPGKVCLLELDKEKQQTIQVEDKPLSLTVIDFCCTAFCYTPHGELLYTNSNRVYKGQSDDKVFKLTAINNIGGNDFGIVALGFCPNTKSTLVNIINRDASEDYFAIDPGEEPRLLLHSDYYLPRGWSVSNIKTIGDSGWICGHTSGSNEERPLGAWLMNVQTGEKQYLGNYYCYTIDKEGSTFLCRDGSWGKYEYYPPENVVKQLKGNEVSKEYNVPGWFDAIKMGNISGQDYMVGIHWSKTGPYIDQLDETGDELYVYDPAQGFLQFLSYGVKGVE